MHHYSWPKEYSLLRAGYFIVEHVRIFILDYGCPNIMSLLLSADLESNTCGMLWTQSDNFVQPATAYVELWRLGDASMLCVWLRRNCYSTISLVLLRAMVRHDLQHPSSVQLRQMLRYAQLKTACLEVGASNPSSGECMAHFCVHPKSSAFETEIYESSTLNKYL